MSDIVSKLPTFTMAIQEPILIHFPPVFRHMAPEYIEALRTGGALRISSFDVFRRHETEHQGDKTEGDAISIVSDVKNNRTLVAITSQGHNAYALSATLRSGPEMRKDFGSHSFTISDPISFCAEVAREIPGFTRARLGYCVYDDGKILKSLGYAPIPERTLEDMQSAIGSVVGELPFFLKSRKYETQAEYRFIWETNKPVDSYLDIVAPNIAQHCRFD